MSKSEETSENPISDRDTLDRVLNRLTSHKRDFLANVITVYL